MEGLKASLARFGVVEPIVWNRRSGRIVGGHQRAKALAAMGVEETDVVSVDLGEVEERALNVALNSSAIAGEWTESALAIMDEVAKAQPDLADAIRFDVLEAELSATFRHAEAEARKVAAKESAAHEPPDAPSVARTEPGDLWRCGDHRVLCGDSTDPEVVTRLMAGERADVVFTDPPYAIFGSSTGVGGTVTDDKIVRPFFRDVLAAAQVATRLFAQVYVCCDWRSWPSWWEAAKRTRMEPKNLIVWDKGQTGLGFNWANTYELVGYFMNAPEVKALKTPGPTGTRGVMQPNLIRCDRVPGAHREHYAAKPVELCRVFLEAGSDRGDLALDLFAGSGSTLAAAEECGRRCVTVEIDPKYVDVTVARWERLTGKKATRERADGSAAPGL
jgi:DNA modification methylase